MIGWIAARTRDGFTPVRLREGEIFRCAHQAAVSCLRDLLQAGMPRAQIPAVWVGKLSMRSWPSDDGTSSCALLSVRGITRVPVSIVTGVSRTVTRRCS